MAVTKIINSEEKQYKPVLVDRLVLDTVPTVGSFNGVTSDGVAQAISGSGNVPTPAAGDNGKVLTADNGSYAWAEPTGTEYSAGEGITISDENAISVSDTIRNGAAAGATAVQPGDLATVATSGSYADLSNKPSIPAAQVNSDWNAVSGVAQILNKPTIPSVDQSYSASSTNAQSGVAVAEAIAAIPSASYTAGDGIDITSSEVSVNAGTGLSFESAVTSTNLSAPPAQTGGSTNGHSLLGQLNADIVAALKAGPVTVKPLFAFTLNIANGGVHFAICEKNGYNKPYNSGNWLVASDAVSSATSGTYTMTVGDSYTADFSTLDAKSTAVWAAVEANPTGYYLQLISYMTSYSLRDVVNFASVNIGPTVPTEDVVTCEVADASAPKMLAVSDPIPSHSSTDENKVLTVNSSGKAVWATPSAGPTYTAGNMIAINNSAIGVSTTAGITDIQKVNALPASPVSTVLYLIPEA